MLDSGIREIFACGLLNHLLWNPEYNARNPNPTDALINVKPAWEGGGDAGHGVGIWRVFLGPGVGH